MQKLFNTFLPIFLFAILHNGYAQNTAMDSLDTLIKNAKSDTLKINFELEKAKVLVGLNLNEALVLYAEIIDQANEVNYRKGKIEGLKSLARIQAITGDFQSAMDNLVLAKEMVLSSKDSIEIAEIIGSKGDIYNIKGDYDKAIPLLEQAVGIIKRNGYSSKLSIYYGGLGIAYKANSSFKQALVYEQAALNLAEKENDISRQATTLVNMATTFYSLKDDARTVQTYKRAIEIAKKNNLTRVEVYALSNLASLEIKRGNWEETYKLAMEAFRLGENSGDPAIKAASLAKATTALAKMGKPDEAQNLAQEAIEIAEISGSQYVIAQANNSMGISLNMQQKYKESIPYFENAAQAMGANEFDEFTGSIFDQLAEGYNRTGQNKKAFESLARFQTIKDSVRSRDNIRKSTEQAMNFEFEKKEAIAKAEQDLKEIEAKRLKNQQYLAIAALCLILLALAAVALIQFKSRKQKQKANLLLRDEKEKVEMTLANLKSTQAQLIQSEKMASLGELTAGIAHEIQNPLNFVNNFSEVSNELILELKEERSKGKAERDEELEDELLTDIKQNLEKINHHGKRADGIVKGMLQHSRSSTGEQEPADINKLADEYLRLSYHGLGAKDKGFNVKLVTNFDSSIKTINIIPQDMGRVILNLLTNAFHAVKEKKQQNSKDYEPTVSISTKKNKNTIELKVTDNGNGIPKDIIDKIFQPFFTTKPTGEGTGLGLSMSYDIITKGHGGKLKVDTKEGEGTTFIIQLTTL